MERIARYGKSTAKPGRGEELARLLEIEGVAVG